jgi:putative transposase
VSEKYRVKQSISLEKLDWLIKIERNTKVQQKLYFIRFRYLGDSIEEATSRLGVTKRTGYYWQNRWNENGYEGLLHKSGAGRPSYLSYEEILKLKTILKSKDFWAVIEVKDLVKHEFNIDYCLNSIGKLLKLIGMHHYGLYCWTIEDLKMQSKF